MRGPAPSAARPAGRRRCRRRGPGRASRRQRRRRHRRGAAAADAGPKGGRSGAPTAVSSVVPVPCASATKHRGGVRRPRRARRRAPRAAAPAGRRRARRPRGRRRCRRAVLERGVQPAVRARRRPCARRAPRTTSRGRRVVGDHDDLGDRRAGERGGDGVGQQGEDQRVVAARRRRRRRSADAAGSWRRRAASPGRRPTSCARPHVSTPARRADPRCAAEARQGRSWAGSHACDGPDVGGKGARGRGGAPADERPWPPPDRSGARAAGRRSGCAWRILLVYPFASLMFRLRYRHAERLPARGPVLLVANHVSILDPIACARLVFDTGRLPHFLAKESVFKGVAGTLLRSAGQIPVARFSAEAHAALDAAKADLDAGNVIVIYPEGRSPAIPTGGRCSPHRGRAAGADHRRRRPPGRPVGAAAGARLPHARSCACASARPPTTWSGSRSTSPPHRARVRGPAPAVRRAAEGDDRPDHEPGARPARRAARGARPADLPPAPAARAARRRVGERRVTRAAVLGAGLVGHDVREGARRRRLRGDAARPARRAGDGDRREAARTPTTCRASGCPSAVRATADAGGGAATTRRSSSSPSRRSRCGTTSTSGRRCCPATRPCSR